MHFWPILIQSEMASLRVLVPVAQQRRLEWLRMAYKAISESVIFGYKCSVYATHDAKRSSNLKPTVHGRKTTVHGNCKIAPF